MTTGSQPITPRARFCAALDRQPPTGRVPHFELAFFPTMEALGRIHPTHRRYEQWELMEEQERQTHRADMADLALAVAERFEHSAIVLYSNPETFDETVRMLEILREKSGDRYFLLLRDDATYGIPESGRLAEFCFRLIDEPRRVKAEAQRLVDEALGRAEVMMVHGGLDGVALCTDYCFSTGPFLSPDQFGEFVTPYLARLIEGYRSMGFYTIKHASGNVMPIIDQLIQAKPHALHSLDPDGGVNLLEVKRRYGSQVCLMGNVSIELLRSGSDERVIQAAEDALRQGMPGGGYVFCTNRDIASGLPVERYELMLDVWRREGNYPKSAPDS